MVSDEAVEAACWGIDPVDGPTDAMRKGVRAALDAAMPHIRQELAAELKSRADYVMRGVTTEKNIPPFASGLRLAARLVEGQTNE